MMFAFFQALDMLAKQGLIDPEKDKWDKPEEWELTKRLRAAEQEIKITSEKNKEEIFVKTRHETKNKQTT